jgi:hypothetical protein
VSGVIRGSFPVRVAPVQTPPSGPESARQAESVRIPNGMPRESGLGQAHDEEAFRHFLAIEHKRSERSGRPYLLLLVDLQDHQDIRPPIDPAIASKLIAGLWLCLRETDVIGWYVANRVVGAVLTDLGDGPTAHVCRVVHQMVTDVLYEHLPPDVARQLQVRLYQAPGPGRIDSNVP